MTADAPELKPYNTEREVAAYFPVSVNTLRRWRYEGGGPKFIKLGTKVVYPRDELLAWVGEPVSSTAEADARDAARNQ